MEIKLNENQLNALINIIDSTQFAGKDAEFIIELKKALKTGIEKK